MVRKAVAKAVARDKRAWWVAAEISTPTETSTLTAGAGPRTCVRGALLAPTYRAYSIDDHINRPDRSGSVMRRE